MNDKAQSKGCGAVLLLLRPLDLELDGEPLRAIDIELPTGLHLTYSVRSSGARALEMLCDLARDPEMPRAHITPTTSLADLGARLLDVLSKP